GGYAGLKVVRTVDVQSVAQISREERHKVRYRVVHCVLRTLSQRTYVRKIGAGCSVGYDPQQRPGAVGSVTKVGEGCETGYWVIHRRACKHATATTGGQLAVSENIEDGINAIEL